MDLIIILALVLANVIILLVGFLDRKNLIASIDKLNASIDAERKLAQQERLALMNDQQIERKELYDRLQAGTLKTFKENAQLESNDEEEVPENVEDLDDAKDDIMGEIEDDSDA